MFINCGKRQPWIYNCHIPCSQGTCEVIYFLDTCSLMSFIFLQLHAAYICICGNGWCWSGKACCRILWCRGEYFKSTTSVLTIVANRLKHLFIVPRLNYISKVVLFLQVLGYTRDDNHKYIFDGEITLENLKVQSLTMFLQYVYISFFFFFFFFTSLILLCCLWEEFLLIFYFLDVCNKLCGR